MTTDEQLVKQYAERILRSPNNKYQTDSVLSEIKSLVHKSSKKPLSPYNRKLILLKLVKEIIDDGIATRSADNANFLELIAYITQQLKDG